MILRKGLDKEVEMCITPTEEPCLYPLIIGEHGTGKTSLIWLAIEDLEEPKGVVYVNIKSSTSFAKAMQKALGWYPDPVIDPTSKGNLSSSFHVSIV